MKNYLLAEITDVCKLFCWLTLLYTHFLHFRNVYRVECIEMLNCGYNFVWTTCMTTNNDELWLARATQSCNYCCTNFDCIPVFFSANSWAPCSEQDSMRICGGSDRTTFRIITGMSAFYWHTQPMYLFWPPKHLAKSWEMRTEKVPEF